MFQVQWNVIKPLMTPHIKSLEEIKPTLTSDRSEVGCLKTGAKVYATKDGHLLKFWVSGYARDYSDIKDVVDVSRLTCFCGKTHMPVAAYGSWCCPDALANARANR